MTMLSHLRHLHHHHRHYPSILSLVSTTPLTSKQKSCAALDLLESEKNPERILEIYVAASFTPDSHLDRVASLAITKLSAASHLDGGGEDTPPCS